MSSSHTTAYRLILEALNQHGCRINERTDKAVAQCPAHDDTNPSLSIAVGKTGDRAVIYCHAGCDTNDVLAALDLTLLDLLDPEARYDYAGGATVHRAAGKQFWQAGNVRDRSLFRVEHLPEDRTIPIYVVEGEKDANTTAYLDGVHAVAWRGGANAPVERYDWSPLKDRPVLIVADNDSHGAGLKVSRRVADLLADVAADVAIVQAVEGKDLTDHIQNGHDIAELVPVHDAPVSTQPGDLDSSHLDALAATTDPTEEADHGEHADDPDPLDVFKALDWDQLLNGEPEPVDWLVFNMIAAGRLYALASISKAGKSLFVAEQCMRHHVRVLYLDNEQTEADLRARFIAMDATPEDLENLIYLLYPQLSPLDTPAGGAQLAALVEKYRPDLVVIDTVSRFIAGDENESGTYQAFYRHSLLPLKRAGVAVLRLDHLGKDVTKGQRGSSAKNDDVDAVWVLTEKTAGHQYTLRCERQRSGDHPQYLNVTRHTHPLRHEVTAAPDHLAAVPDDPALIVVADLDTLEVPIDWGRRKVRSVYRKKCSNGVLDAALRIRREQAPADPEKADRVRSGTPVHPERTETARSTPHENAGQSGPGPVTDRVGTVQQASGPPETVPIGTVRLAGTTESTPADPVCRVCHEPMSLAADQTHGTHGMCREATA